jgi:hypothetical protein
MVSGAQVCRCQMDCVWTQNSARAGPPGLYLIAPSRCRMRLTYDVRLVTLSVMPASAASLRKSSSCSAPIQARPRCSARALGFGPAVAGLFRAPPREAGPGLESPSRSNYRHHVAGQQNPSEYLSIKGLPRATQDARKTKKSSSRGAMPLKN